MARKGGKSVHGTQFKDGRKSRKYTIIGGVTAKDLDLSPSSEGVQDLADFVQQVEDTGGGTIVVQTSSGRKRLKVTVEEDLPREIDMDPAVAAALERARDRGKERAADILNGPDMLSGEELGAIMGITRQAAYKAYNAARLLAISGGGRGMKYPRWQLDDTGAPLQGLSEMIYILGQGWPTYRFLVSRDTRDRLAAGDINKLLAEARSEAAGEYT